MRFPRAVPADRLIRALEKMGYAVVRQKGSPVRMRHSGPPVHMVTVPNHKALKIGTLQCILVEVASMRSVRIESIVDLL